MHHLEIAVLLITAFPNTRADCVDCPGLGSYCDDEPFDEYPLPKCPEDLNVNMRIYTRKNPIRNENITRDIIPRVFSGSRMTMYIVHDLNDNQYTEWMVEMKNAVLEKADYNVIVVSWSSSSDEIHQIISDSRTLGGEIALLSNKTIAESGSSRVRQYCVGQGVGTHICGQAGQQGQFGRITGLDPTGAKFWNRGLDPSCADYVDVIHTNGEGDGTMNLLGHVDFYPNGGESQPSCDEDDSECNHIRAYEYFTESARDDCFLSRHECSSQYNHPESCDTTGRVPVQSLGFNSTAYPGRGIFYLEVLSYSPYCVG